MSHRFQPLENFESDLSRIVAERSARAPRRRPALRAARPRRLGLLVALVALVLTGGTIALAATGVILTGSAVPAGPHVGPSEGVGDPVSSTLLPFRIPDPEGGPPWGMRIVQTSRGLVCAQVGRVQGGALGEIGIDGAFADDGLFHPFPREVVQSFPGGSTEDGTGIEGGTCALAPQPEGARATAWGSAVAAELWGVDRNAAPQRGHVASPASQRRDISYGLLGPHAVSVSYREGSDLREQAVAPGVGAYLIVQRAGAPSGHEGGGAAPGTQTPGEGPGTDGALTAIAYRQPDGTICENGYDARTGAKIAVARTCPPPAPPAPAAQTAAAGSRVQLRVHLRIRSRRVLAAEVSFKAPFAVRSASQSYTLWSPGCGAHGSGGGAAVFTRNVPRGGRVVLTLTDPFAVACARSGVPVEVMFDSSAPNAPHSPGKAPGQLVLAKTTIPLPAGDRGEAARR